MVQFIRTLPRELEDAAKLDGCGHIASSPGSWSRSASGDRYHGAVHLHPDLGRLPRCSYLNDPNKWTVTVGLNGFLDTTGVSAFGPLFAMATVSIAPIVGFFLVSQRMLVEGVATTGIK